MIISRNIDSAKSASKKDTQEATLFSKGAMVILSAKAKAIQEAIRLFEELPDVREDKVAQIKVQIQNGTYEVDAKNVAAKMIEESVLNDLL